METQQNSTNTQNAPGVEAPAVEPTQSVETTILQQMWIDYKAVGGFITTDEDTVPKKMTVGEFANNIGVDRTTLYYWTKHIPNFWEKVNQRRLEIGSQERLSRVHNTWYLKALAGSFPHMQLWLANFDPKFKMPAQKVEHEVGDSWAELIAAKRNLIEGEVVNNEPTAN